MKDQDFHEGLSFSKRFEVTPVHINSFVINLCKNIYLLLPCGIPMPCSLLYS